jgi:membrane protein DedA with SNARE-associated domain
MLAVLALMAGTLVSEDLACIAAGLLIQRGQLSATAGIAGCALGIFLGDLGLWAIGRLGGRAAPAWPWLSRAFAFKRVEEFRSALKRRAAGAIIMSRFLPGTRLPVYVTAGIVGIPAASFSLFTLIAVSLWAPVLVLVAAQFGAASAGWLTAILKVGTLASLAAAGIMVLLLRAGRALVRPSIRRSVAARVTRWRRWEFWPMWLFYAPVAAWVALLAIRYRGLSTITAANPGMPDGGTVGESKFDILARLPAEFTIPTALVPTGQASDRLRWVLDHVRRAGWSYPLIMKPDVGQRGVDVKLVRDADGVRDYLLRAPGPVLIQPYHEGPFEAGVFYYRMPRWPRGRIFSITDKEFPFVTGNGRSTLEELVWEHPRYRMQASLFLSRHRAARARVLDEGERFQLAIAGNHAQGTLFRDGSRLLTPALADRIDAIAHTYPGFFVGRFDIRFRNVEDFKAGRDLAIVELNGASAESTNIYDPDGSLLDAYRQLFRQWSIVFAIGAANRAHGHNTSSPGRLFELVRAHLMRKAAFDVAD